MAGFVTLLLLVAADQAPPPPPPPTPDSPDFDAALPPPPPPGACEPACRKGFVCVQGSCVPPCNPPCAAGETCMANGECVPPAPGPAPITPAPVPLRPPPPPPPPRVPAPKPIEPPPPSVFAIHLNLADAAFGGLTGALDFLILEKIGIFIEARAANAGVLSYFDVFPLGPGRTHGFRNNYATAFESGYGASLGGEKFFGDEPGLRGLYVAGGIEVLNHRMKMIPLAGTGWNEGSITEWFVVPHARAGMRWRGHSFLFALGARLGAGIMASSVYAFGDEATSWGASRRVFLDASLILDLGFFLK